MTGSDTPPALSLALVAAAFFAFACGGNGATPAASAEPQAARASGGEGTLEEADEDPAGDPAEAPAPEQFEPAQGEHAFGVYLADVTGEPEVAAELSERLEAIGFTGYGAELGCDHGSAETLGLEPDRVVVSVSFRSESDARAFVVHWGQDVLGVAEYDAYCRD